MPTNTDVLDKLKADLAARSGRATTNTPKIQLSGMMDMPWAKNRVDFAHYDIKGTDIYDVDRHGNTTLKWENYKGATGNENRLALQQSWGEKAGNGITKLLGKTGLIAADALATVTYGLASGISQGSLSAVWDNELSKLLDDQSKKMDKSFAHYYSDEEKAKSLFGQALTANFWFNDVGNGLAFVAGTVLSEVPLAILTGGASAPSAFAKAGARLGLKSLAREGAKEIVEAGAKGIAKSADNIAVNVVKNSADDILKATAKTVERDAGKGFLRDVNRKSIDYFTRATATGGTVGEVFKTARFLGQSVMFEAGMEARHSFTDAVDKYVDNYKERYGELPSAENLGAFIEDARSTANGVFAANAALLSVTNFAMFSKFFDLKAFKMPKLGVSDKILGRSVTTLEDGSKLFTRGNKAQRALGTVINVAKPVASEGFLEEGMQGVFGNTMEKYLDAKYDPKSADTYSLMESFTEALMEQYTTKDGLKEVFIGGIIGLLGGNVGAAISKPATALGVKGMEGGSFGITGLGKDGYGAQLNAIDKSVKEYNKTVEKFRDLNRASSIGSFRANKQTGSEQFTILEDSVTNYNFIKSNEALKGYADTVADFEAAVNALEFTKEQMTEYGFDSPQEVADYKNSIIEGFKTDYTNYKRASKTVNALGIDDQALPDGSKVELKDATTLAIMQGLKAGNIVNTIGDNISQLTGEQGAYSTLKFYKEVEKENGEKLQELKDLGQQISDLTTNIAEVGAQMQEVQGNEVLAKELSKKHATLSNQLIEVTNRQKTLRSALDANLQTIAQEGNTAGVTSINELVERYDKINTYVSTLKKVGKTKDAKDLDFLMKQFDGYLALEANSKDTIQRMANSNFYSSKEGKSFLDRILGKPYSMSEEARKEIRDNEEVLNPILEKLGYKGEDLIKELEKALTENTDLSDREKFKIESMIRARFAYNAIQESIDKTQESIDEPPIIEPEKGDTLAQLVAKGVRPITNIEELNELIKEISGEIDLITNEPTLENLKIIRENQKRIEALQKEIADIESGVVQPSQIEEIISPESRQSGEITESSTQLGEIEDSEYNDFVDNGEVSEKRLIDIANKVKNQEELSERENAIFTDKTAEINNLIASNEQQPTSNQTALEADKADIERRIQEVENFINQDFFANSELLSNHWKTKKDLFENKIKQLKSLLQKGIKTGEDLRTLTDLLNDIRGILNEGVNINDKTPILTNEKNIQELANSLFSLISDDVIKDYIQVMNKAMESRIGSNAVEKMLVGYSDGSGYTIDGKNVEYFLSKETLENAKNNKQINAKYDAEIAALEEKHTNEQQTDIEVQIADASVLDPLSSVEATAKALEGVNIPVNTPIKGLSVRMTDLKIAEENLAKGKKSVTPNAPVDVTINLTTGERELSDGYHRYLDARGGTIEAAKTTNLDGTIPAKINFEINEKSGGFIKPRKATNQEISEAYHKAKADGSNPELVKAVEELLTPQIQQNAIQEQADTNIGTESTANEQGESRATIEQVNIQSKEQAIAERVAEIDTLESENNELKTPFKFMESEGYKKYLKLLNKRLNEGGLTPTEEDEFNIAEKRVNQWISILGASNGQLELTDLIKQLVALENAQIEFTPDVTEVSDEEVSEDAGISNKQQNRNRSVGLNYEVAVTQEVVVDGVVRTSVHNLTLDAFKELAGVPIEDSDVVVNPITKSFTISRELVDKINEAGSIRIMSVSVDEASTYYSSILQAVPNMEGEVVYSPLASDYNNSDIKREDVYNTKEGEELTLSVDPSDSGNEDIIALIKAENSGRAFSEKERAEQVDIELQKSIAKSKTITNLQAEISRLNNLPKTTDNKAKLNKATQKVKDLVAKLKEQAEDKVEKRNSSDAKIKISKELRNKIATELKIVLVNSDEVSVQILKGTKTNSDNSFEGNESKFFALRRQLANDDVFLMQLLDNNNQTPSNYTVKVEKVYPGLPNFNTKLSDGVVVRESKLITEQGANNISDIGYVKDGKLHTRNKSENVDETFINTSKISNRSSKTPVVIIKQGEKLIAFPVRVARNESPIDLNEFKSIFENKDIDNTEKAIRLNTILATAGIDVKQKGNAFIDLGNGLNTKLFDNLFAQLEQKEYLSGVDSWIDPKTDIKETLVDRVSISLDMSKPFVNPKIKLDLNSIDIEIEENEVNKEAKEKSAISSATSTVSAIAGVKKYKFCE